MGQYFIGPWLSYSPQSSPPRLLSGWTKRQTCCVQLLRLCFDYLLGIALLHTSESFTGVSKMFDVCQCHVQDVIVQDSDLAFFFGDAKIIQSFLNLSYLYQFIIPFSLYWFVSINLPVSKTVTKCIKLQLSSFN